MSDYVDVKSNPGVIDGKIKPGVMDMKINPTDVLTDREFEVLAEAVVEYLGDKTGFYIEHLTIGFDVTYLPERMDCEECNA